MEYKFNKGSEWRKWDLHVHTPESGLANTFGDWDRYVKVLFSTAIEQDVAVLGITDYFTIDGYKKIKNEYQRKNDKLVELFGNDEALIKRIQSIKLLPNIEFRLNKFVGKNRINYHVIFSDEVLERDIEENFLHDIEFIYESEPFETSEKRKLKKKNLEELGEKLKREQSTFKGTDFEIGCMNAVVSDEKITELLENIKSKFRGQYIICLPADEDLSAISWKSQDHLARKLLIQKSNIFFSTNKNTIDFGLGKKSGSIDEFISEFKSLKPCLSGSDVHSCEEIESWLGKHVIGYDSKEISKVNFVKKTTWIKADPTFEGLKQILCEPEGRVRIQGSSPETKKLYNVIEKVRFIDNSGGKKFSDHEIGFNPDLNAIIGGKSSGKSLLMHLMAKSIGNNTDTKEYADVINGVDLEVYYADDPDKKRTTADRRIIEFLPQLYIEKIVQGKSAAKSNSNSTNYFNTFISDLIQQDEQIKGLFDAHNIRVKGLTKSLSDSIGEWIKLDKELTQAKKELLPLGDKSAITKEILNIESKIRELTLKSGLTSNEMETYQILTKANEDVLKEIADLIIDEIEVNLLITNLQQPLIDIIDNSIKFETKSASATLHFEKFKNQLKVVIARESSDFIFDLDIWLGELISKKSELKLRLENNHKQLAPILEKNKIQTEIQSFEANINAEKNKLAVIEEKEKEIQELKAKRDLHTFIDHYSNIIESYNSLKELINEKIGSKWSNEQTKLTLKAASIFDDIVFVESVSSIINVRTYLQNQFENCGFNASSYDFSEASHIDNTTRILEKCISDVDRFDNFKTGRNTEELLRALLKDCNYIDFDIKKGEDSLRNMSEGKKGIVILQLYLSLSKADYPILIDQPEDNLDNRTVYIELNDYIKKCKERRQIILVSHNANLVVNTDAENIIVANQMGEDGKDNREFRFEYVNGSLENTFINETADGILYKKGIREHVCEILEGGTDAFKKREEKYHLNM